MGTPTNRTPVRVARGSTTALNTGLSDIQEGEIVWDTTLNRLQVKEGSALENSTAVADAGKQDVDADLTALSSCQTGAAAALALLTSTEVEVLDGATVTTAELNYSDGVTSNIQTQINTKAPTASPAFTGAATFAGGSFGVASSGEISTNIHSHGHLKLDSGADFSSPNISLLADTGAATFAGSVTSSAGVLGVGDAVLANDQNWTGAQRGAVTALTDGATIAVDFNSSNNYSVTLAGNRTLGQPTNQVVGQSGSIFVTQDGTGSRTLAYHADWKWAGGTAPTLTTTAAAVDRIDYIVAAANKIHAVATLAVA
jgi:hypothetical protein